MSDVEALSRKGTCSNSDFQCVSGCCAENVLYYRGRNGTTTVGNILIFRHSIDNWNAEWEFECTILARDKISEDAGTYMMVKVMTGD